MGTNKISKKKIIVSKANYNEVESTTMLLAKLKMPLDLLDDLIKIQLENK